MRRRTGDQGRRRGTTPNEGGSIRRHRQAQDDRGPGRRRDQEGARGGQERQGGHHDPEGSGDQVQYDADGGGGV